MSTATIDGVERVMLNQDQAAAYVGLSTNTFVANVRPFVRYKQVGRRILFPVAALDSWANSA